MNTIILDQYGRLRSGWRFMAFLFSFGLISVAVVGASVTVLDRLAMPASVASQLLFAVPFAISTAVALGVGWLCGRSFERVPYRALGASPTHGWLRHLVLGLGIGGVAFLLAIVIALVAGGLHLEFNRTSAAGDIVRTVAITFVIFAVGAASEETLFRGYMLQTFMRSRLTAFGVALTASLFAAAHNANPDVSSLSLVNTLLAGVWFAAAYLKTRDLWFPFGIHLAWNWLQGPVFGISVSGISSFASDPLMRATDSGPAWLTGGDYGIEGGVACTLAIAASLAMIRLLPGVEPDPELTDLTSPVTLPGS
jgi:membrane protease YdiL (CAAX protease family)